MAKRRSSNLPTKPIKTVSLEELDFVELVEAVRRAKGDTEANAAFEEIERRMQPRIKQISFKFRIPGFAPPDVYQESLFALRFKAIKDYDKTRGDGTGPYPFDKFAVLCIRRHLSTKLKASYQCKKRVLNSYVSLDQDRNDSSNDQLFLADILPRTEGTILDGLEKGEYHKELFTQLFRRLSSFEQMVFKLYVQRYSYEEISGKINEAAKKSRIKINIKSVDNALSRIKHKAQVVFDKYGDKENKKKPK